MEAPGDFTKAETQHTQFNEDGQPVGSVIFDLDEDESDGTQKLFFLTGPILDVLSAGRILAVDENEARMHPLITCAIIRLFNSFTTNPKRAQLIFTAHDTNLLDRSLFRRDQIWFVEKDSYGASHLYSLVEFMPRYDESFERNYLHGKYGAIPYLGDLSQLLIEDKSLVEAVDNAA
jgi:AAA15 family ATPase/GTPase